MLSHLIMTKRIIKPIIAKSTKYLSQLLHIFSPYIKKVLTFSTIATLILVVIAIWGKCEKTDIKESYQKLILNELQDTRDLLAYSVVASDKEWYLISVPTLSYESHVANAFSDNSELAKKIQLLYKSLNDAILQGQELRTLQRQKNRNETEVDNLTQSLRKIISHADKVGPLVAEYINDKWETPLKGLSTDELVNYYYNRLQKRAVSGSYVK